VTFLDQLGDGAGAVQSDVIGMRLNGSQHFALVRQTRPRAFEKGTCRRRLRAGGPELQYRQAGQYTSEEFTPLHDTTLDSNRGTQSTAVLKMPCYILISICVGHRPRCAEEQKI